ncbi:MAG TPA: hypothetical protein RMH99_10790 [Sandaracinaceae bacterium LLY-WYZ-13_1]|nr:hypothetical protein [Sandaracinaceae bacterium LLY-WYZ-13_1]
MRGTSPESRCRPFEMHFLVIALLLALTALPAAAQAPDPRLRTLARWTAQARRSPPDPPLPDARALQCRTRSPSCGCGGLPVAPMPRATNGAATLDRLVACVDARVAGEAHPEGRIEAELHITSEGRVHSVRIVADEVGDARLTACVRAVLSRMRYEPVGRRARVLRWPLLFAPPEEGAGEASAAPPPGGATEE